MTVKTREADITTQRIPGTPRRLPPDIPDTFKLTVTDDAKGSGIEAAFRRFSDCKFEAMASHLTADQLYKRETTIRGEDAGLFKKLLQDGFFILNKRRVEPEEQTFNLLLNIRNELPAGGEDSFFTKEGLGGLLLSQADENKKPCRQLDGYLGSGQTSDYLRRIGSMLPFMPERERIKFLAEDAPRMLKDSKSYLEFLEKTASYLPESRKFE